MTIHSRTTSSLTNSSPMRPRRTSRQWRCMLSSLSTSQCLTRPNTAQASSPTRRFDNDQWLTTSHSPSSLSTSPKSWSWSSQWGWPLSDWRASRLWSIRIFQVNKGTSTAAQGTAPEDKSSLHCCYPQQDYVYVISTILKLVLNFVYNFVIFLLFFLESTFLLFL